MRRHLISTAAWVVGGQALTAAGTLLGVRLLTQFLPPEMFGIVSLGLGVVVLVVSVACTPLTQAAMHFYTAMAARGGLLELRETLLRLLLRMGRWLLPCLIVAAGAYAILGSGSVVLIILLFVLLTSDCWRSVGLSMLNAARRHRHYALWTTFDSWGRPLLATAVIVFLGASPTAVLAAYAAVSLLGLGVFFRGIWQTTAAESAASRAHESSPFERPYREMWQYALPLVPLGLIGWISNLGDRYLIGGVLGIADAGVYAAVYGLSSAPFMIIGGSVEQALRPVYQNAVAARQDTRARDLFVKWLATVCAACAAGVLAFALWHEELAALLLGQPYRYVAHLMPWIAAGYALRSASYVFERVCYAYGQTQRVLTIQSLGALATLVLTPLGAVGWGLTGAALAVPACFAIQLLVAIVLARRAREQATRSAAFLVATRITS